MAKSKSASSWKEIELMLQLKISEAMNEDNLGKDIKDNVEKRIQEDVYSAYTPKDYQRTGEFGKSVVSTTPVVAGNSIEITIKHNPNLMNMKSPWYHQSVVDGRDSRFSLPEIIHGGKTFDLWGHSGAGYLGKRPYMDNTVAELKSSKNHVKKLVKHLRALGLDAIEG